MIVALAALVVLNATVPALAVEQRTCRADVAIFPNFEQQRVEFRVVIAATESVARVRVDGSGEWDASRSRAPGGAETIVFETRGAIETLTIGLGGEFLWQLSYKNEPSTSLKVVAFIGTCDPWRLQ